MAIPLLAIAAIAAAGFKAYGERKQFQDMAKASAFNSLLSEQEAQNLENAKNLDLFRLGRQKDRSIGTARALYAKAGVTSDGSPLEVLAETAFQHQLDMDITRYNYDLQKSRAFSQADQYKQQAKAYRRQSIISPLTTFASSAANLGMSGAFQGGSSSNLIQTSAGTGYRHA